MSSSHYHSKKWEGQLNLSSCLTLKVEWRAVWTSSGYQSFSCLLLLLLLNLQVMFKENTFSVYVRLILIGLGLEIACLPVWVLVLLSTLVSLLVSVLKKLFDYFDLSISILLSKQNLFQKERIKQRENFELTVHNE